MKSIIGAGLLVLLACGSSFAQQDDSVYIRSPGGNILPSNSGNLEFNNVRGGRRPNLAVIGVNSGDITSTNNDEDDDNDLGSSTLPLNKTIIPVLILSPSDIQNNDDDDDLSDEDFVGRRFGSRFGCRGRRRFNRFCRDRFLFNRFGLDFDDSASDLQNNDGEVQDEDFIGRRFGRRFECRGRRRFNRFCRDRFFFNRFGLDFDDTPVYSNDIGSIGENSPTGHITEWNHDPTSTNDIGQIGINNGHIKENNWNDEDF